MLEDKVTLGQLKRFVTILSKNNDDDTSITAEFILTALYPNAVHSLTDFVTKKYIEGYQAGYEEREAEMEGNYVHSRPN